MAITTKWLEEQGLTAEQATSVFAERGKEIEAEKTTRQTVEEKLTASNTELTTLKTTITALEAKAGEADTVKVELTTLRQQMEADTAERAKEAEKGKLAERFKTANGEKKLLPGLDEFVHGQFVSALKDEANKGKSDADILSALTLDKGYYQSQNPSGAPNIPGHVENPAVTEEFKKQFDAAKSTGNRAAMSAVIREAGKKNIQIM